MLVQGEDGVVVGGKKGERRTADEIVSKLNLSVGRGECMIVIVRRVKK